MRWSPAIALAILLSACGGATNPSAPATASSSAPGSSRAAASAASSEPDWSAFPTLDVTITNARPFPTGFPALLGVAPVAFGSWWVTNGGEGEPPKVRRLDLETLEVTAVIDVGGEQDVFPPNADGAAVSANGIWVGLASEKAVVLVDPATNRMAQRIEVDANPYRMLENGDKLWISDFQNSEVLRVDISTGEEELRVSVPGVTEMRVGPEGLWVLEHDGFATRLDPATGEQVARLEVGARPAIALGLGSVWAGSDDEKTLSRIDPATNTVVATIELPSNGRDAVVAGGSVWIAVSPQRGSCERTSYLVRIDPSANEIDGVAQLPCVSVGALDGGRLRVGTVEGGVLSIGELET